MAAKSGLPDVAVVRVEFNGRLEEVVEIFVFEENNGVVVFVSGQHGVVGVLRRAGIEEFGSWNVKVERLEVLRVEGAKGESAAAGEAKYQGSFGSGAEVVGAGVESDLRGGVGREVGELEFDDGSVAVDGLSCGVADHCGFAYGRIDDAATSVFGKKSFGDFEWAAVVGDVLPHDKGLGRVLENLGERPVDCLGEGDGLGFFVVFSFPVNLCCRLGEDVFHEPDRFAHGELEGAINGLGDERFESRFFFGDTVAVAFFDEAFAEVFKTIFVEPLLGELRVDVIQSVVASVSEKTERMHLDEHGPSGFAGLVDGVLERFEIFFDIGHVELDAFHAVAFGSVDELAGELLVEWGRVGVVVIFDYENDGNVENGSEIHALVDFASAGAAVAEERNTYGFVAFSALGISAAEYVGGHLPQMTDHRVGAVLRVAVMGVAFAAFGWAAGVSEKLANMVAEVIGPDEVAGHAAMGPGNAVDVLVHHEGERGNKAFVSIGDGDGAFHFALAVKLEDARVGETAVGHPTEGEKKVFVGDSRGGDVEIAFEQYAGRFWIGDLATFGGHGNCLDWLRARFAFLIAQSLGSLAKDSSSLRRGWRGQMSMFANAR